MVHCCLQIGEYEETIGTCIAFTEQGELRLQLGTGSWKLSKITCLTCQNTLCSWLLKSQFFLPVSF